MFEPKLVMSNPLVLESIFGIGTWQSGCWRGGPQMVGDGAERCAMTVAAVAALLQLPNNW